MNCGMTSIEKRCLSSTWYEKNLAEEDDYDMEITKIFPHSNDKYGNGEGNGKG